MNYKIISLGLLIALGVGKLSAQIQTRALPILETPADARTAAMGGSHYGYGSTSALYTNPTSALYGERLKVGVTGRTQRFPDVIGGSAQSLIGSASYRLDGLGVDWLGHFAVLVGGRYAGGREVSAYNAQETYRGSKRLYDATFDIAIAGHIGGFSAYGKFTAVQSYMLSTARLALGSFGISYRGMMSESVDYIVTAKAENIGGKFHYSRGSVNVYPPTFIGLGGEVGFQLAPTHRLQAALGMDSFVQSQGRSTAFQIGAEYSWNQTIFARAGYHTDSNDLRGFSCGLGGRIGQFSLDASYVGKLTTLGKPALYLSLGFAP